MPNILITMSIVVGVFFLSQCHFYATCTPEANYDLALSSKLGEKIKKSFGHFFLDQRKQK